MEECLEIYEDLLKFYQSEESAEPTEELMLRTREIKSWYRKLIKKLRNRKNTQGEEMDILHSDDDDVKSLDLDDSDADDNSDSSPVNKVHRRSSEHEDRENHFDQMIEFYNECLQNINKFIHDFIGIDKFKSYSENRKKSFSAPFIYETTNEPSSTEKSDSSKQIVKKQNKKSKKKKSNANKDRTESNASVGNQASHKLSDADMAKNKELEQKDKKLTKKEMKEKIKALLPLEPPKPTVSLDDPDYHIVEVNGEFRKIKNEENVTNYFDYCCPYGDCALFIITV